MSTDPERLICLVDWYQRAADGRPSPCRFTLVSSYAREALEFHGVWRGLWLTIRRLIRCRPFGPSGFDPVPEPAEHRLASRPRHRVAARSLVADGLLSPAEPLSEGSMPQ